MVFSLTHMASVDGKHFHESLASDERFEYECDVCKDEGKTREANYFCPECNEYYCTSCEGSHRRMKATRNHQSLSGKNLPKSASAAPVYLSIMYCSCNQSRLVEIVCNDHHIVCCSDCAVINHRNCKTSPIDKEGDLSTAEEELNDLIRKANDTEKEANDIQTLQKEYREQIKVMESSCNESIENFQLQFHKYIDSLALKTKTELKKAVDEMRKKLDNPQPVCNSLLQRITKDMSFLQIAKHARDKRQMFVSVFTFAAQFDNYNKLCADMRNNCQTQTVIFQENKRLSEIQCNTKTLGSLLVNVRLARGDVYSVYPDILNVEIKQTSDITPSGIARITGATFLPNGEFAVCDYNAKTLLLLDASFRLKSRLECTAHVWDVSPVNSREIVVTLPSKKHLQFIWLEPELHLGRCIDTGEQCYGVDVVGDEIFVSYYTGNTAISILGLDGKVKRRIGVLDGGKCPFHLAVSRTSRNVFVSDCHSSEITCLSPDGRIIQRYTASELKQPRGILLDSYDNFLVCNDQENNYGIMVFKANSSHQYNTFPTVKQKVRKPYGICYRSIDKTVVVVCYEKILAFELE